MWTPDALASELRAYRRDVWRVVETQYRASTMRITDTLEEQAILEDLLEESKPALPPSCEGLHYLLATPFRYAPYPHGSRFRRAHQPEGVFYASETVETALAETAFHRLLFFAESPGTKLPANPVEHTAFSVPCATDRQIDLTAAPLCQDRALWTDPVDYAPCHDLADAARAARVEAIRYESVRDRGRDDRGWGVNLALLSPEAFAARQPTERQTWQVFPRRHAVQAWCDGPFLRLEFTRDLFSRDPRLAALDRRAP